MQAHAPHPRVHTYHSTYLPLTTDHMRVLFGLSVCT